MLSAASTAARIGAPTFQAWNARTGAKRSWRIAMKTTAWRTQTPNSTSTGTVGTLITGITPSSSVRSQWNGPSRSLTPGMRMSASAIVWPMAISRDGARTMAIAIVAMGKTMQACRQTARAATRSR